MDQPVPEGITPIAVTMGDPSGIGPEITCKAWEARADHNLKPFFVLSDPQLFPANITQCIEDPSQALDCFQEKLPIINIALSEKPVSGQPSAQNSRAIIDSLNKACSFAIARAASAVVTAPINKHILHQHGFDYPGQTEFFADKTNTKLDAAVMMLCCPELKVIPLTIHISLKEVSCALNKQLIKTRSLTVLKSLQRDFGLSNPVIYVCGLNPHAGESGSIGHEDQEIIQPAIHELQQAGHSIYGPYSADTMFHEQARTNYDAALAMYHDQALIPIKTLNFHQGVNVTLGLPIIRTSPDHGTAYDIAGKNLANPESMISALQLAAKIAENRARYAG